MNTEESNLTPQQKAEVDEYWRKVNEILDTTWPLNLLRVPPKKPVPPDEQFRLWILKQHSPSMITHNIHHKEGDRLPIEQCIRAKIAESQGWEPYFTVHADGDMTDSECAQVPTLEELLITPKNLATALLFLVRSLDSPLFLGGTQKEPSNPIYQILHKK